MSNFKNKKEIIPPIKVNDELISVVDGERFFLL
jgi:hypothetical protein